MQYRTTQSDAACLSTPRLPHHRLHVHQLARELGAQAHPRHGRGDWRGYLLCPARPSPRAGGGVGMIMSRAGRTHVALCAAAVYTCCVTATVTAAPGSTGRCIARGKPAAGGWTGEHPRSRWFPTVCGGVWHGHGQQTCAIIAPALRMQELEMVAGRPSIVCRAASWPTPISRCPKR
jgi:hypothetical protein